MSLSSPTVTETYKGSRRFKTKLFFCLCWEMIEICISRVQVHSDTGIVILLVPFTLAQLQNRRPTWIRQEVIGVDRSGGSGFTLVVWERSKAKRTTKGVLVGKDPPTKLPKEDPEESPANAAVGTDDLDPDLALGGCKGMAARRVCRRRTG